MKDILKYSFLAVFAVVIIAIAFFGLKWALIPFQGALDEREQILGDGTYRIASYEHFYDQCSAVQALEDQIDVMESDESLPEDQKSVNLLALTNQRNTLIRQYNADARKEDTRANFMASDLPYQLDKSADSTVC